MKSLVLALSLAISASVFANSVEEAKELYSKRGDDRKNALAAADMYKSLADAATDSKEKGLLKTSESEALYYYGNTASGNDDKKKYHERGYNAGKTAYELLSASRGVPAAGVSATELATAHYFYGINEGKWGQANGIGNSIMRLPGLVENMELVIKLDRTVEDYGAHRTLGRLKHKVPASLAWARGLRNFSVDDAIEAFETAYENTLVEVDGIELSSNSTTVVYYLDALAAKSRKEEFCEVLFSALDMADAEDLWEEYSAARQPETRNDLKGLVKCVEDEDECSKNDFESGADFHKLANRCR